MTMPRRNVIVIGGGPIGLLCAIMLAQRGFHCSVLDARPLEQARGDERLLALSRGTWEMLAPILGPSLPPRAPIREVFVSSAGDFGSTRISASDFDGADLGATVRYGELLAVLASRAAMQPNIEVLRPVAAAEVRQRPEAVEVLLADGRALAAELAVHAEGTVATAQETGTPQGDDDWALLAEVRLKPTRADLPAGAAFERFTRSGSLALLPTPGSVASAEQRDLALVWCMSVDEAQRRRDLSEEMLRGELQSELSPRLGKVEGIRSRRAVGLPTRMREQVNQHRVVALGNAAQTLHPVAGQGFNLGVRDCATLSDELAQGNPAPVALARYASRRRTDRTAIALLTRALPAVFASRFAPLAVARGAALALLDITPDLRRQFAHLLIFGVRS